jgi:hypothetical protein
MAEKPQTPKRLNRTVGIAEALGRTLDPALRRRGFAKSDIVTHWAAIAPAPYDRATQPDKLVWPRGQDGAGGAVLHVRCAEAQKLALAHEGQRVAAAINRYFGYVLVREIRLSPNPFSPGSGTRREDRPRVTPETAVRLEEAVAEVGDDGIKQALRRLGAGVLGRPKRQR